MSETFTYPCLVYQQRSENEKIPRFCLFAAKVKDILEWADIKRLVDQSGAAQRSVNRAKVLAVRRFLELDARNTIPTAIIVNLNVPESALKPLPQEEAGTDQVHMLSISADNAKKAGVIVDGQHRVLGIAEFNPETVVNVVALLGADDMEAAFQFMVINNKAAKVSTDHIRALARDFKTEDLDHRLRTVRLNLDSRFEYVGIADADDMSPFRELVDWPSNRTGRKVVKPAAIEGALADIERRKVREFYDQDTVIAYFFAIWNAVKSVWPSPWTEETNSRLLSKVGIVCMSAYLTDALVAAYDWVKLDISDPGAVTNAVKELLSFQEEKFWSTGWTSTSLDTKAGRDIVLESLSLVARNKRATIPWYEDVAIIDVNQLDDLGEVS